MVAQITPLPAPPQRNDPASFAQRGDAFLSALPDFAAEANALAEETNQAAVTATGQAVIATTKADEAAGSAQSASEDAQDTAADREQTGLDRDSTAADREQTGLDAAATAADRVQTGLDRQAVADGLASIADGPVTRVNMKTGDVTLSAADVGAIAAMSGVATGLKFTVSDLDDIVGATEIDLATAQEFTATVTGDVTVSFTNPPAEDQTQIVYLRLTNGGAHAITWPANTKFDTATAPTLTAEGVDLIGVKYDSTTSTYMVFVIGLNVGVPA